MTLTNFNNRYSYKLDVMGRDLWFVIKPDIETGLYQGDCEVVL